MNWLERNSQLLAEVQTEARLQKGLEVGRSGKTTVTAFGSYHSTILGGELYLCLKVVQGKPSDRAISNLAFIRTAVGELPHLEPEFPQLLGLLRNGRNGRELGILTEDFSQGTKLKVVEVSGDDIAVLPRELLGLVGPLGRDENYELAKTCFLVQREDGSKKRRLGDFDTIRAQMDFTEKFVRFSQDDIDENLGLYTVTIDYNL